jgi:hypothetical protein
MTEESEYDIRQGKRFSLPTNIHTDFGTHPASPVMGTGGFFLWGKSCQGVKLSTVSRLSQMRETEKDMIMCADGPGSRMTILAKACRNLLKNQKPDRSPKTATSVKYSWTYTSTPSYVFLACYLFKDRNKLIFCFYLQMRFFRFIIQNPCTI